jgi:cysteine desulfurase
MQPRIYLDNAATTPMDPKVIEAMLPIMTDNFGNPSSIHAHGRRVKSEVEKSRKKVAELLHTSPSEIFFTSGGTEADNTAIRCTIEALGLKHAITSEIEHHAVLHTLQHLEKHGIIELSYVKLDEKGHFDAQHLQELLETKPRSLVSLMQGNNEIGNLIDLEAVSELCKSHDAIFHSDTVQTMGHYTHDLQAIKADFIVGASHKFNGPKGVGFLYVNAGTKIHPFIHGGAQERNMRGGTENVYGIVGLAKALELAYEGMESHRSHIEGLKQQMISGLSQRIEGIKFNGDSANLDRSLYTVLNVSLPPNDGNDMLLFNLDIDGISCSGGSACSSGTDIGSHVLNALNASPQRGNVRFSFGKFNTEAEINKVVDVVSRMYETAIV